MNLGDGQLVRLEGECSITLDPSVRNPGTGLALASWRQQIERHREDRIDHQDEHPTNHADRPLLVTSEAVSAATSIITTAPGQNSKSMGAGPMT